MSKTASVFIHLSPEGPALFGSVLEANGFVVNRINVPRMGLGGFDPLEPDLLMVMGGPVGVYQADDFPFLEREIEIIRARIEAQKPTIGICLGSQIMARALGSDVYVGQEGKEAGWIPLRLTEAANGHPVEHLGANKTMMFHWHGDTFDLPEGARLLASTEQYPNQVYEIGRNVIAFQCHPEVFEAQLEEWYVMLHAQVTGANAHTCIHSMRQQSKEHIGRLNRQSKLFFEEWLRYVELL